MNEKNYKKKIEFQQKVISKKSEEIESLKMQNEKLKLELEEKNNIINSVASLKEELTNHVNDAKKYKEEFRQLVGELRKMKTVLIQDVFKGEWKWKLIQFLIK